MPRTVNGPKDGSGTNQYYRLAKGTLGASNILMIVSAFASLFTGRVACVTLPTQADDRYLRSVAVLPFCLPSVALLIAMVRYDIVHPNEDAEGAPGADLGAAILFDPDPEEV